ncbi:MAG: amino acid ABC transporter substrate-binding protein [Acidimicrobiales bacterium]
MTILVTGAAIAGCGSTAGASGSSRSESSGSSKQPIVVGMSASKTGAFQVDGIASVEGNEYAATAVNEHGGWLGRKIKLVTINDQSEASKAQQAYDKLITQEKVNFVIGPYAPELAAAAGAVATRNHYVMLDPETALPIIKGSRWAIQDEPSASLFMQGFPAFAAKEGLKTIAIIGINNAFGEACVNGQKKEATEAGMSVVYTDEYAPEGNTTSVAEAIKGHNPAAVDVCSFFSDGVAATKALNKVGFRPKMLGVSIAPSEPTFTASVGKLAERVISTETWAPGLKTEGNEEFVKGFTKQFGHPPDYHAANGYASMQVLGDAIASAKSFEQSKVLEALYSHTYHTVLGTFELNNEAVAYTYGMYLYQIQNGQHKLIYPSSVAEGKVIVPYTGS